jgi:hypothetical protein
MNGADGDIIFFLDSETDLFYVASSVIERPYEPIRKEEV